MNTLRLAWLGGAAEERLGFGPAALLAQESGIGVGRRTAVRRELRGTPIVALGLFEVTQLAVGDRDRRVRLDKARVLRERTLEASDRDVCAPLLQITRAEVQVGDGRVGVRDSVGRGAAAAGARG